jgi:acetyl esterase
MSSINRDVAALLAASRAAGSKPFEAMTPEEARHAYLARREIVQCPPDAVAEIRNVTIRGINGADLALRFYRGIGTDSDAALPCLLYLHGGGWVLGNLLSHEGVCCRLANEAGCWTVAVDYRLAPEHPFPAALDNSATALAWIAANAAEIGIDRERIAVGGDSAGGNLAAVLALMGRDGAVHRTMYQILLYPALDLDIGEHSYPATTDGMTITGATMRYFVDLYLPRVSDRAGWRASPAKVASLKGSPPAFILSCGHDPLADEGRRYAERLEREGIAVTALYLSDQTHSILTMDKVIAVTPSVRGFVGAMLRDAWRPAAPT